MLKNTGNYESELEVRLPRFVSLGIKLTEAAIATAVFGIFLATSAPSLGSKPTSPQTVNTIADNHQAAVTTQTIAIQFPVNLSVKN